MSQNLDALLRHQLFIGNAWCPSSSGQRFAVTNPATGELIAEVEDAAEADVYSAIEAAWNAFPAWSRTTGLQRAEWLRNWYALIIQHAATLAQLMTLEQGKPLAEARAEVSYGAGFIDWFAGEARRIYGDLIPAPRSDRRFLTLKQPVGVVAAITPWNFPVAMITRKLGAALAAGCTAVVKPSELTPLCALALAQLAQEAGIPAGVINVVTTTDAAGAGKIFCSDERIRKISFTGSTAVGKTLMAQSAPTLKKLSLELGGNAPVIVCEDADIGKAVAGTLASKYRNAGQTCVCANRIFVHRQVYEPFLEKYRSAVAALQTGNGLEPGVQIGPLINERAMAKVERLVADAIEKGAERVLGGDRVEAGSLFYQPTILSGCTPHMQLSREEIFGPVSALYVFDSDEEAIQLANQTEYGLAAYFFSERIDRFWRYAEALEYGIIGANEGIVSFAEAPFGGIKQSGYGKEGGRYGIEEYLVMKYVCVGAV